MPTLAPVKIIIAGVDKFSRTFKNMGSAVRSMGNSMGNVGRKLTMSITLPVIAMGVGIIKTAAQFEKSMNKVEALTQAPSDQLKKMSDLARDLGANTKFSAVQAANAMSFLGMAGWKSNQILQATPHLLDLAAASSLGLARAADITSNIMGAFGINAKDTKSVVDILASATASANVDMEMLGDTMQYAAPLAKDFGTSLKDAATIAGALGNIGIQGSSAGTAMKGIFNAFAAGTPKAVRALKKLGVAVDVKGKMRPVQEIFTDLGESLNKLSDKKRLRAIKDIFGKIAGPGASALARDLSLTDSKFLQLVESMRETEGRAKKIAEIMNKGLIGAGLKLKSAFQELALAIADTGLLGMLTKFTNSFANFIRNLAKANPKFLKWGTIIAGILAILGPLLIIMGGVVTAIGGMLAGIGALASGFAAFANPIGIAVIVISALMAAFAGIVVLALSLRKELQPLTDILSGMFFRSWEKLLTLKDPLKIMFSDIWDTIKALTVAFMPLLEMLFGFNASMHDTGMDIFIHIIKEMIQFITELTNKISFMTTKFSNMKKIVTTGWSEGGFFGVLSSMGDLASKGRNAENAASYGSRDAMMTSEDQKTIQDMGGYKTKNSEGLVTIRFENVPIGMNVNKQGFLVDEGDEFVGPILGGVGT